MATGQDIRAALDLPAVTAPQPRTQPTQHAVVKEHKRPQPRMFKKPSIRARARATRWTCEPSAVTSRKDALHLRRWHRAGDSIKPADFSRFNIHAAVPEYDAETYEKHLTHPEWTKSETDYLMQLYLDCNGKWTVIADHFEYSEEGRIVEEESRTMENLKVRFYGVSAKMLELATPISSMTASDYSLHQMLANFNPNQEISRKKLAEGHLYRKANEVDEETVLLGELQRIMLNQATLDNEREELRRRLDYPSTTTNGYQYTTSSTLNTLWQQLIAQDRMKKNPRLRPTGNPAFDGVATATPTSARPRESIASVPAAAATPQTTLPSDLSKADSLRFGVVQVHDKLPSSVSFASDRLSKPRIAKSTIQTDKIAAILAHIGVPDIIPLPTPPVVERFDSIMSKVATLLEMRKVAEKEEQELRVRTAEASA